MRIAILCFGTSGRGGMETVIGTLLRQFAAEGDTARLFLLGGSKDDSWTRELPITVIGKPREGKAQRYLRYIFSLPFKVRAFAPNVILCADPRSIFVAAKVKKLFRLDAHVASWVHFTLEHLTHTNFLRHADLHFAISGGIANDLRNLGFQKVHLAYNPVVPPKFELPRAEVPTFLYVGRVTMAGQKRTDDFLHALSGLTGRFAAVVIGSGADEDALKQLSRDLGLADKVTWLGWQSRPWSAAPACTALVLTSKYEGFAMVLAEAISHGLPCLSTDCRTGPSEIINRENGWLVPVGDVGQLTDHMQRIIDNELPVPPISSVKATAARFSPSSVTAIIRQAST